jgi:CRISPR-associated protein Csm1
MLDQQFYKTYTRILADGLPFEDGPETPEGFQEVMDAVRELKGEDISQPLKLKALQAIASHVWTEKQLLNKNFFPSGKLSIDQNLFATESKQDPHFNEIKEDWSRISALKDEKSKAYSFYSLLYSHAARCSCSTEEIPDVSLFDRNRILAAIYGCIHNGGSDQEKPFLLVKGEISGIQTYIYRNIDMNESGNSQRVAQRLRGRSFFVGLMADFLAETLAEVLDLPPANVLFAGGGNFLLLLPNKPGIQQKLGEFEQKYNLLFRKKVGADFGFFLAEEACDSSVFKQPASVMINLGDSLNHRKHNQHINYLEEVLTFKPQTSKEQKQHLTEEDSTRVLMESEPDSQTNRETSDKFFDDDKSMGQALPYAEYLLIVQVKKGGQPSFKRRSMLPGIESLYDEKSNSRVLFFIANPTADRKGPKEQIKIIEEFLRQNQGTLEWAQLQRMNNPDFLEHASSFQNLQIPVSFGFKFLQSFAKKQENGSVATFEELAKGRISLKENIRESLKLNHERLGVIKLDVDDLGATFGLGLRDKASLSRIASLSRELQLFFGWYLNHLAEKYDLYVVYSGGDDAFIIGSWFNTLHFIRELRKRFQDSFACGNQHLNFSAGLFIANPHFPIPKLSEMAEELQTVAKGGEKNQIHVFNRICTWKRFDEMLELGVSLEKLTAGSSAGDGEAIRKNEKIRRSMVQRLLTIIQVALHASDEGDMIVYQNLTRLKYLFARMGMGSNRMEKTEDGKLTALETIFKKLLQEFSDRQKVGDYLIPTQYVLLNTREKK